MKTIGLDNLPFSPATHLVDLDLSAVIYDTSWWYKEHISFTNLRSAKNQACHSGDITTAPNGVSEFIDIDIPSVLSYFKMETFRSRARSPFPKVGEYVIRRRCSSAARDHKTAMAIRAFSDYTS